MSKSYLPYDWNVDTNFACECGNTLYVHDMLQEVHCEKCYRVYKVSTIIEEIIKKK